MNTTILGVVIAAVCILAIVAVLFIVLQNGVNNSIRNIGETQDRRMREFSEELAEMNRSIRPMAVTISGFMTGRLFKIGRAHV